MKIILLIPLIFSFLHLTSFNVDVMCKNAGICEPEIVVKQSILETGNYKCKNCSLKFNNIFGFLLKSGYIKFNHWIESVIYYKDWQDSHKIGKSYYDFLIRVGYAEDSNYIYKLKSIKIGI